MNSEIYAGDIIVQLISLGIPIIIIIVLSLFWLKLTKNKKQLEKIEEKLKSLNKKEE